MMTSDGEFKFLLDSLYDSPLIEYKDLYKNEGRLKLLSSETFCVPNNGADLTSVACSTDMSNIGEIWEFLP